MPARRKAESEVPKFPKIDNRLIGTWKSDKRRTLAEWAYSRKLTSKKREQFETIFGKLEIVFTHKRIFSKLRHRGWERAHRYAILGTDYNSAAIVIYGRPQIKSRKNDSSLLLKWSEELPEKPQIKHIHFEGNYIPIVIGNGKNREFFRKLPRK